MGIFWTLFGNKWKKSKIEKINHIDSGQDAPRNENVVKLQELGAFINSLMKSDRYVAKSDYLTKMKEYEGTINFFRVLESSGMLESFCGMNGISLSDIGYVLNAFSDIEKMIDQHNEEYIKNAMIREKAYLDNILREVDPAVLLDEDQRRVVLTDEDYCLVIAGAGKNTRGQTRASTYGSETY